MPVLSVQNLSKNYGPIVALNGASFDVPKGAVFGILGPNGSGKTTTLGIITGVLQPTSGSFTFFDQPPTAEHRKRMGALLETPNFYHYLSALENLRITAGIKGKGEDEIESVLTRVNLIQRKNSAFSTYSLGMKQRLAIGAALLGSPEVLILDEPTNGLDPVGISEIRELIKSLSREGKTIIMASHLLDEVEKVCTHMVLLKKGKVIVVGKVSDILAQGDIVELSASGKTDLSSVLNAYPGVQQVELTDGRYDLIFDTKDVSLGKINEYCFSKGITLDHLVLKRKTLESRFLELTEEPADKKTGLSQADADKIAAIKAAQTKAPTKKS